MAYVRSNLNEIVAKLPGVQKHVTGAAHELKGRIQARILPITRTGHLLSSVTIEMSATGTDRWVVIGARYAAPVNYGFFHWITHERVRGRNFIKGAIYG